VTIVEKLQKMRWGLLSGWKLSVVCCRSCYRCKWTRRSPCGCSVLSFQRITLFLCDDCIFVYLLLPYSSILWLTYF